VVLVAAAEVDAAWPLLEAPWSSLRKLGPEPTTGVAKFNGLGKVLLSLPRKFQSG